MSDPDAAAEAPVRVVTLRRRDVGGFRYALGADAGGGYGAGPRPAQAAPGSAAHRDAARFIVRRMPGGFWRLSRIPSRRMLHKALHFLFARHAASRIANALVYFSQRQRVAHVDYMPPLVFMDPTSKCNLRCPGCATGLGVARKGKRASLDRMTAVIDQVAPTAWQIAFYHLGEAFLNDDVFAAIAHARAQGLWTLVTSHLSLDRPELGRRIAESGLHELQVSVDGATPETYAHYRRGGDLDRVWSNLREIRAHRERLGRRTPFVRVKMLVFEHNWHEALLLAQRARAAGADEVQFFAGNGDEPYRGAPLAGGSQFDVLDLAWKAKRPIGRCEQVWQAMHVTPDGGLYSCCLGYRDADLFVAPGTPLDLRILWNAPPYVATRKFFLGEVGASEAPANCQGCLYVKEYARGPRR